MAEVSADLRADGTATSATTIGFKFRASNKVGVFAGKASVQPKSAKFTGVVLQKQHVARGFVSGSASGSVLVTPRS